MKIKLLCITILVFMSAYSQDSCSLNETLFSGTVTTAAVGGTKLKASDATSNHRFGERVAIDGNVAAVSSRSNAEAAGKVYIFTNDGSGNWTQQTIITANDGFAGDNFGSDVALEGNYLVVGARSQLDKNDVDTGAAYLFEYNGISAWTQVTRFEPSDGTTDNRFGTSVAIEGDLILIGARKGCTGGCAYLFENDGTNTFTYTETKLEPQVQSGYDGARFGETVVLEDGRAYVGGPYDYSSVGRASAGSVQVWDQANDGTWSRTHRLRGTETSESFGWEMDVEGDYLAIGAMNFELSSTPEADQGRVYVYKADSNGDYLEENRVMIQNDDKDSFMDQRFGSAVALEDGFLYVGTWGAGNTNGDAVYIFKDDGTNNWTQIAKITTGSGWDEFSNKAVVVSYPNLLIGQNEDDSPSNSGAVHFIPLASTVTPTASITEVRGTFINQNNGSIKVNFDDEATRSEIKFSIDGGTTYPYVFNDDALTGEITNLGIGSYNLKATFNNGSCVLNLGNVSVNQVSYTAIPDAAFEAALESLGYDDISGDGQVPTSLIESLTILNISSKGITDLTGIEDFTALTDLNCENNTLTSLDVSMNTNLQNLIFNENDVASLVLGANTNLASVEGKYNQLNSIDITQNTGLTFLNIRNNLITSIDVSNNTLLQTLNIRECANVTDLNVSNNVNLKYLYLQDVSLTNLDVSQNTLLEVIALERNNLSSIDVSNNLALRQLRVADNNLTRLDASGNPVLTRVSCENNNLSYLNVQNGNNTIISNGDFNATGNTLLSCIKVDDASWSNSNWTNIDSGVTFFNTGFCRYTSIPDSNFEASLYNLGYDDVSGDGRVPTDNIENVTSLDLRSDAIADLTGIEDFISLTFLNLKNNNLTSINLSNNAELETLGVSENSLTAIDLSKNLKLASLDIGANPITSLDVSNNTALTRLEAPVTDITSIDVSKLTQLSFLELFQTDITSLDLSNNLALGKVILYKTKLTALDVSLNTELTQLRIDNTNIASIDLSTNTKLDEVRVNGSLITSIDLTNQSALTQFYGQTGVLEYINIRNGNNSNITNFDVRNNDDLTCITVDDATYSTTNWTNIGTSTNFIEGLYCDYTDIPDANFESQLESLGYDDIPGDGKVPTRLIKEVSSLTINNKSITDFTGIEDFVGLTYLDVGNNKATSIDISNLVLLEFVRLDGMSLTSIDLTNNTALVDLRCSFNSGITSIDLSKNTLLETAHIGNNSIANIDISSNTLLYDLRLSGNNLTTISLTNNTALQTLIVSNNPISNLDLSTNTALTSLYASSCGLTTVTNINSTVLQYLYLQKNTLTSIDFSKSAASIEAIYLFENSLTDIDVSGAINLKKISIYDNNLIDLNLSEATGLEEVYASDNDLSNFNLKNGNNTAIHEFHADNNPSLTCILVDDASLSTTRWSSDIDNKASFSDTYCRYTAIPDSIFETRLESLGYDDISGDGQVPTVLIETVTSLTVNDLGINELTGIEDFTALVTLNARGNNFTTLDMSQNLLLEHLYINSNNLSSIDVSTNVLLRNLNIGSNSITSLDLSKNPDLRDLWVQGNGGLTSLDLSNNLELRELYTYSSGVSTLDLSIHAEFRILSAYRTPLASIDLSNNPELRSLRVDETNVTLLDLTNNTKLETLRVNDTGISSLDLSSQSALEKLWAHDTSLSYLNVKNGNNTNVITFEIENNPSLTCVLVDDAAYSTTNWTNKDSTTNFGVNYCDYTSIPDPNFEAALEALGYDDISGDGQVPTDLIEVVTSLNVGSKNITDLTGIEDFKVLEVLRVNANQLTSIDLSNNAALKTFAADSNFLKSLNVNGLVNLTSINVYGNLIESIDVSTNTALTSLDIFQNKLTSIDVSANTNLERLFCNSNDITSIDVSANSKLKSLVCKDNDLVYLNVKNGNNSNFTEFDAVNNAELTCITVDDVAYSTTNWTNIDSQSNFNENRCDQVQVSLKVYLQGAYINPNIGEEALMRDDLRIGGGIYGGTSPYADGAMVSESIKTDDAGIDSMVDWVWVELRDANDPSIVIAGKSGVLQRDGDIVDVTDDRISPLSFQTTPGNYYIVVKHRNHLSIMTSTAIDLSDISTNVDLTSDVSNVTGGINSVTDLGNGIFAMISGDYDENGQIQNIDTNSIIQKLGVSGYNNADLDMNGQVQNADINNLLNPNVGKGEQF
ncbi:hypothetical protein [Tenacibaculum xiamenense]|uniref:hypothetical protein n=1 Tax=Tenacibaculum xiamenense TaxID=1261553 RepID=UPI00389461A1